MVPTGSGPSLETYIETRFNLLTEAIKDAAAAQTSALGSSIEAMKQALAAADLRYEQRFNAQTEALSAAFLNQQLAMKTALEAAKEAVLKAELAADKRFEALNELRQMLNDTIKILMTRQEVTQMVGAVAEKVDVAGKRMDTLEARLNITTGEQSGNRRTKDDTRAYVALGVSLVIVIIAIATFVIARMQ